jgi:uncharacterized membrane protein HdeD (DUF308 family)
MGTEMAERAWIVLVIGAVIVVGLFALAEGMLQVVSPRLARQWKTNRLRSWLPFLRGPVSEPIMEKDWYVRFWGVIATLFGGWFIYVGLRLWSQ